MLRREVLQFLGSLPFVNLLSSNKDENVVQEGIVGDPDIEYNNIYIYNTYNDLFYYMLNESGNIVSIILDNSLGISCIDKYSKEYKKYYNNKRGYGYLIWKENKDKSNSLVGICIIPEKLTPYEPTSEFLDLRLN